MPFQSRFILILGLSCAVLTGCEREDPIVTYSAPKEPDRPVSQAMTAQADAEPTWTLPEGWTQAGEAGGMRYATINLTPDGSLVLTVLSLPQQPMAPNINRWQGQVGLPPTPAEEINTIVRHMDGDHGTHFDIVDLKGTKPDTGKPHQMLAALLDHGGKTWSFKIEGAPEQVAPLKDKFEAFLKSVKFGGAAGHQHVHESAQPSSAGQGLVLGPISLPPDWRDDPTPRQMREKTLFIGNTQPPTEVVISRFSMPNFSLPMNLNRWRQQVELGAATPEDMAKYVPQSIQVGGNAGSLFDVVGPNLRQLVVMSNVGGELWFVKMLGPKDVVSQQESTFRAFVNNMRFVPGTGN